MGLIDYMSQNPVGSAIPPSEYDEFLEKSESHPVRIDKLIIVVMF